MPFQKKKTPAKPLASSQIVAHAEKALEQGAKKAITIYLDKDDGLGYLITEEASIPEVVFMLRQTEHILLSPSFEAEDDDYESDD